MDSLLRLRGIGSVHFAGMVGLAIGVYLEHYVFFTGYILLVPAFFLLMIGIIGLVGKSPTLRSVVWFLVGFGAGYLGGTFLWPPPPIYF